MADATHRHRRPIARVIVFLLSIALLLLSFQPAGVLAAAATDSEAGSNGSGSAPNDNDDANSATKDKKTSLKDSLKAAASSSDGNSNPKSIYRERREYEIKIQKAMEYHGSKSHQLLQRALKEGGASSLSSSGASAVEIDPNGNLIISDDVNLEDELLKVEFALESLEREIGMLNDVKKKLEDEGSRDDDDDDEEYYSGDEEAGDDYDYAEEGEDMDDDDLENIEDESLKAILDAIKDPAYRAETYASIIEEEQYKAELDPELWFDYKYWDLHAYFNCDRVFAQPRAVYDAEKWGDLREFYHAFVKKDKEDVPIPEGKPERSYQYSTEDFDPPLIPFQAGEKGRGLKAGRDISKGELVFKATNNTIIFTHGHTWRKFLFAIHERYETDENEFYDDETTCDVLVWSWVQALEEDGPLVIVSDLDNGSLLNEGRDEPGWESPNVRCGKEGDTMCLMSYYATKDIKEGDELLCDYRQFAMLDSWPDMGL